MSNRVAFKVLLSLALNMIALPGSTAFAASPKSRVEMSLLDKAPLDAIEINVFSPNSTRPERLAVSDLLLDVWTEGEDIETLLDHPTARSSQSRDYTFRARVIVVSGGKLHTRAVASCGAWELNMAICNLDCDGGRFGLMRRGGEGSSMLRVLIGNLPRAIDVTERPGFVLSACGIESAFLIRLVPKSLGKPVEFGFVKSPRDD